MHPKGWRRTDRRSGPTTRPAKATQVKRIKVTECLTNSYADAAHKNYILQVV